LNGRGIRFAAAAFLFAGAAAASPAGPADDLSRAAKFFQDGKAHRAAFVQTFTPAGFTRSRRESGALVVQAPESLRFDYETPKKVFTFDGKVARFYSAADRQMTVKPLSEADRAQLPLVFLESPEELARNNTLQREEREGGSAILVTPKDTASEVSWIRLTLSESGAPVSLSFQSSSGDRTEFRFETFRGEPAREPDFFSIHHPAGTRILDNEP